jgi:hypothetical protein
MQWHQQIEKLEKEKQEELDFQRAAEMEREW